MPNWAVLMKWKCLLYVPVCWNSCCGKKKSKKALIVSSKRLNMFEVHTEPLQSLSTHCLVLFLDPFGGDPFNESDPFKGTSSEDFFKRTDKSDLFGSSDPFGRKPTPPAKVSNTKINPGSCVCNMTVRKPMLFCQKFKTTFPFSMSNDLLVVSADRNKL